MSAPRTGETYTAFKLRNDVVEPVLARFPHVPAAVVMRLALQAFMEKLDRETVGAKG
jgi:hypothetical protein